MAWFRRSNLEPLAVSMSGVKLGDRLLVIGTSDIGLVAALAVKAGISGRACLIAGTDAERDRAAAAVEQEGGLVEAFTVAGAALPFDAASFDVVVLRHLRQPDAEAPVEARLADVARIIRPGGRCLVIEGEARAGLAALVGRGPSASLSAAEATALLSAAGFRGVRTLAERDGMLFIEGVKTGLGDTAGSAAS